MANCVYLLSKTRLFQSKISLRSLQNACVYPSTFSRLLSQTSEPSSDQIVLTNSCIQQLKKVAQPGEYLRVIVEGGGCSGFQYKFDIDSKADDDDRVFSKDGVKVIVDNDSLEFLKGSKIDYQEELIRSAFVVVDNPLAEEGCSCGASFNVKL